MAKKEFHVKKGDREVDFSVEYRMPTKQEFLGIAGIISIVSGVCLLVNAFILKDE
ncbi:MAG: hypothetical protein JJU16_03580 [Alkalibacterium sp.]|nr:hypothetical protein [Alkalibacterium sp.]